VDAPVFLNDEDLFSEVERFDQMGLGIFAHATGDAANRQVIDAVERVKKKHGMLQGRHQSVHDTLIYPDDVNQLKELDIPAER
jgi:predicted amidohydrolase YtcJ